MMVGNDRGDAVFNDVVAANPNMSKLSPSELSLMKQYFELIYSSDTVYIVGNMDVLPNALSGADLNAPSGIPSTGADPQGGIVSSTSTASQDIAGKGSVQ